MAIVFNCPHCHHQYKFKDELGGKTATCMTCRQKFVISKPTVSDNIPPADTEPPPVSDGQ